MFRRMRFIASLMAGLFAMAALVSACEEPGEGGGQPPAAPQQSPQAPQQ